MAAVEAEFVLSAADPAQFPADRRREVAFAGRSNVGKSSLINKLIGTEGLAFTSSRPGCTRTINFYNVGPRLRLVDLPGYGYAQGPIEDKLAWKVLIDHYLSSREHLALTLILIDSRRGWMPADRQMREWLESHQRAFRVVATKVDKLNQKEYVRGMAAIRQELDRTDAIPFSARDGRGAREIWQAITNTTE
jgi:GTP-binding protein